jgi:pimeloyl-ACP methyl ester carboxylesterase
MPDSVPVLLVPGLACSPRLYASQLPALWHAVGPVTVADHTTASSVEDITAAILALAPPRFHLVGLSMGGYISLEILRQAPERVAKLALLDTTARPDLPEQTERRRKLIALAETGKLFAINDLLWPLLVHESRQNDAALRATLDAMMDETGADAFIRQQHAIIGRPDSRPFLPSVRAQTLVIVGDSDKITTPVMNEEIAAGIPGARLETVRECGHLSTLEQPAMVTKLLVDWLA